MTRMLLLACVLIPMLFSAQNQSFTNYTNSVYNAHPSVPRGILEAVSFVQTRMTHLDASVQESCTGMPRAWGYLGLIADGEGYFRNNLQQVSHLSGISVSDIVNDPARETEAYATAFEILLATGNNGSLPDQPGAAVIREVLLQLTFIPDSGWVNDFARNSELLEIFRFLNNPLYQQQFNFPEYNFDLRQLFGNTNYNILSSPRLLLSEQALTTPDGIQYSAATTSTLKSTEYTPAIWNPAATCNFSSRNGTAISAITIHTIQGTYAGAISWAQNCSSSVSYHYVLRSSDGQVTQMVGEASKAWHVGSENPYTIGYEHEGYVTQSQWYTDAMYSSSAALSRDIVGSGYGIPALRTYYGASSSATQTLGGCTKIKGHQHFPNQTHTDPGIYWNWEKYYRLINNNPAITTLATATGNLYDSGGSASNYQNDERQIKVIAPANAVSVTLQFTQFSVESGYDKLFIYDGNSINATLIGTYTGTTSPGTITSTGGALTIEFRSDCATVGTGWAANWTSTTVDNISPVTSVETISGYQTDGFTVHFTDSDVGSGVAKRYARISDRSSSTADWHGNSNFGYLDESFNLDASGWTEVTGNWANTSQAYVLTDNTQSNSNASIPLKQDSLNEYLYHWKQTITSSGSNQRAGVHFFCDNTSLTNRGNSYFVYLREGSNLAQIYEVINDTWTLRAEDTVIIAENVQYDVKTTYNPGSGSIRLFVDNELIVEWIDPAPLKTGNGFSLRSGGCAIRFDDVSAYKSRFNQLYLSVGADSLLRYESTNAAAAARATTMIMDYHDNWSVAATGTYLIDWSAPQMIFLNDGITGNDIDTNYSPVISGNWDFIDLQSDVTEYAFAIGTSPATQDILPWTPAGLVQSVNHVLNDYAPGTNYYVHVRAFNNAGLVYETVSDGQVLLEEPVSTATLSENDANELLIYPVPADQFLFIPVISEKAEVVLMDLAGRTVYRSVLSKGINSVQLTEFASGHYQLMIIVDSKSNTRKILIHHGN